MLILLIFTATFLLFGEPHMAMSLVTRPSATAVRAISFRVTPRPFYLGIPSLHRRQNDRYLRYSLTSMQNAAGDHQEDSTTPLAKISIEYCTGCRWMLRAAWLSQELLTTFQEDLHSVSLVPSRPPSPGGTFIVTLNGDTELWNRKLEGRFPETKELKQRIRDALFPDRDLGHSDVGGKKKTRTTIDEKVVEGCVDCKDDKDSTDQAEQQSPVVDMIEDDDEAAELRNYFGVA